MFIAKSQCLNLYLISELIRITINYIKSELFVQNPHYCLTTGIRTKKKKKLSCKDKIISENVRKVTSFIRLINFLGAVMLFKEGNKEVTIYNYMKDTRS